MNTRFFGVNSFALNCLMPWAPEMVGQPSGKALFTTGTIVQMKSDIAGGVIEVESGFLTDLASIPKEAWVVFMSPDDPRIAAGAVIHDKLYGAEGKVTLMDGRSVVLTREQCDKILAYEAMGDLGASKVQQDIVYIALREFGDRWSDRQ